MAPIGPKIPPLYQPGNGRVLQAILHPTPWVALHGAAICRDGRAVLLAGRGKAGKTSLALAAIRAGWSYAGDDFVLVRSGPSPCVAPLYRTARLRSDMVDWFSELLHLRREISNDEGEIRYELAFPAGDNRLLGGGMLAGIALIERNGAATPNRTPVSRALVVSTLATTTTVANTGLCRLASEQVVRHCRARTAVALRSRTGFQCRPRCARRDDRCVTAARPTISAVIAVHNGSAQIGAALASVHAQTVPVTEIIVVDDGSTDDTAGVVGRVAPDARLLRQPQGGPAAACNTAVAAAHSELIATLDHDDTWPVDRTGALLAAIGTAAFVCGRVAIEATQRRGSDGGV